MVNDIISTQTQSNVESDFDKILKVQHELMRETRRIQVTCPKYDLFFPDALEPVCFLVASYRRFNLPEKVLMNALFFFSVDGEEILDTIAEICEHHQIAIPTSLKGVVKILARIFP